MNAMQMQVYADREACRLLAQELNSKAWNAIHRIAPDPFWTAVGFEPVITQPAQLTSLLAAHSYWRMYEEMYTLMLKVMSI